MKKKNAKHTTKLRTLSTIKGNMSRTACTESGVIIGIGASAGGLEALRSIFSRFNGPSNASYIVVQHMSPTFKSMLTELLSRDAHILIVEAQDNTEPLPNTVYVTPSNADIIISNGRIRLEIPDGRIGPKPSIDRFLVSLAQERGEKSGAVILSGTGSDGAHGIKAIKAAGGFTIAQSPESAKYDGMPKSAINTGAVDLILNPLEIADELEGVVHHVAADGIREEDHTIYPADPLKGILEILERRTKVDFSRYKLNTIERRLERRMTAVKAKTLGQYYEMLKGDEAEVMRLFNDVLISVTSFFRDREQFDAIKREMINYRKANRGKKTFRIWSAGCSTGEEPYSLAIAANEAIKEVDGGVSLASVQIFATDISEQAMAKARRGSFAAESLEELDPDLVSRYFDKFDGSYQVKKSLREQILFARHDLTQDPPFLKMDLISCRNVFIYFSQEIQDKILKVFQYALNPDGLLFLGKSETVGNQKVLFEIVDPRAKIYVRKNACADSSISFTQLTTSREETTRYRRPTPERHKSEIASELIREFAPDCIVLDEHLNVISIYGEGRRFLTFPDGDVEKTLENLAVPDMKTKLMTLVHRSRRSNAIARSGIIQTSHTGKSVLLQACAFPVKAFNDNRYVLALYLMQGEESNVVPQEGGDREIKELERELLATREHLQTVTQEQETANEELQSLNEELQSTNEELQSTNEELETSNEELQSTNEELTTLNEELNVKSAELTELASYLSGIQDAIQHPMVVVDPNFNIVRYNTSAQRQLGLSEKHIDRNLRFVETPFDLSSVFNMIEESLKAKDRRKVHFSASSFEFDVTSEPIFSANGDIVSVVVIFIDNTYLSHLLNKAQSTESRLFSILSNIPAKVSVKDASGRYTFVNPEFCNISGVDREFVLGKTDIDLFGERIGEQRRRKDFEALKTKSVFRSEEVHSLKIAGDKIEQRVYYTSRVPLVDHTGAASAVCSVGIDISERAKNESRLRTFQKVIAGSKDSFLIFEMNGGDFHVTFASDTLENLTGMPPQELIGLKIRQVITYIAPNLPQRDVTKHLRDISESENCSFEVRSQKNDVEKIYSFRTSVSNEENTTMIFVTILDITVERVSAQLIQTQQQEVLKSGKLASLGEMAAGIAHELKTPLNTIQGYVDLVHEISRQGTVIDSGVMSAIDHIEETVTKISDIIVGLKSISKTKDDQRFVKTDLKSVILDALKICEFHLKNRGVAPRLSLPEKPVEISARPTQLTQVLINLINNAVDAVRDLTDRWIAIELDFHDNHRVVVRVIDSGNGIPESISSKLMTPFFTTKQDGTGLGLSLSKNIVLAHQGSLTIDNSRGNTCFAVILPVAAAEQQ